MLVQRFNTLLLPRRRAVLVVVAALLLAGALFFAGPVLLWAYNVERAGALIERGLAWPEPRQSDSLPTLRDDAALSAALGHLAAARAWWPGDARAPQLAGEIYLAQRDWRRAAFALAQAHERAPANPLLAWQAGLASEQVIDAIQAAPRTSLMDTLAKGGVDAPGTLVRSIFCNDTGSTSCYFGQTQFTLPYAESNEPQQTLPVLFLHAPALLKQRITVPASTPLLDFAVGLDPVAHGVSSGAALRVWVEDAAGGRTLVYERYVDGALAARGWLRGAADLAPWIGREVVLVLETGAGPNNNTDSDWYGWGDIALVAPGTARADLGPLRLRTQQAWRAAGFSGSAFERRGKEARAAGDADAAQRWFRRAELMARFPAP